jgi:hydroxylaminobenzene mutase
MNRLQMQQGFVLILLALVTGLFVQLLANPRLGLASHIVGITGGLVLIVFGAVASAFQLSARASAVMMWCWVYAAYGNWFGSLVGAITGASRLTPIAGAATRGSALAEGVVEFILKSLAVAAIVGTSLAIAGLRRRVVAPAAEPVMPGPLPDAGR